ncbi:DoxX family membrane protein [Sanguibacter suaedae]|uniref:DoxX family membrane protein n=1 Tax=Sanguibacter suaedae TaxID=2795737 RepID=A0A934I5L9_9MICO|nr:DoxX family membrane protein [Sanguibacter suaedae]MBI9116044.1 DoxX family membrane protein [Sanguibacter suaedae]
MLLRPIARPLLATWFVSDGVDAVRHPSTHVHRARATADRATTALGQPPLSDAQLTTVVRAHGGLTVAAGLGLALGRAPRSAALLLAALTVPLVLADEPFTSSSAVPRSARSKTFVQRLGALGATLLAAADHEGRPGLAWRVGDARARRAAARADG